MGDSLGKDLSVASLVFAAGRGSRMKGFDGSKTLLPLAPEQSPFQGTHPILLHILNSLPPGPKALVIHHRKEELMAYTRALGLTYCEQPVLNGTGGALLAARGFIEKGVPDSLIITMGDVPFVKEATYLNLVKALEACHLVVLGFRPQDKRQYGVLEMDEDRVNRIIEWKYWNSYPGERLKTLQVCNTGIYAARTSDLIPYLRVLEENPHKVIKEREGKMVEIEEFFVTDLVEFMSQDGLKVGCVIADYEHEVMGIDDLPSLLRAQEIFRAHAQTPL
jgi:bifunctional UDP-N-acetylglucosamine pyrophosphorylase/glucosamine-1-phosphate N-acetyltransferase